MSTNNLHLPITSLGSSKKPTKTMEKLIKVGIETIEDLLWVMPLRVQKVPGIRPFSEIEVQKLFLGKGKITQLNFYPAFGRKGKGRVQLFNANVLVKDSLSENFIRLRWFNAYPNIKKQLEQLNEFVFLGTPTDAKDEIIIANPQINPVKVNENEVIVEYPTINTIAGRHTKALIDKIPDSIWNTELPDPTLHPLGLIEALKVIHGKNTKVSFEQAVERLKYQEFFNNQIKARARRERNKALNAPVIISNKDYSNLFSYELTNDQKLVLEDIKLDLKQNYPMMRMVQGDVGCGKTSVAIIAALMAIENNKQVAFMCPTEALATQHYKTLEKTLPKNIHFALLLGSTSQKDKKQIYADLKSGKIDLIIGTHSLIQDSVEFKDLAMAIIDEQHKFGVGQRLKLFSKGQGVHSIIMSATPIPRSLQLAQYGDLSISTIRELPGGRKGIKTRIVTPENKPKFLSFVKTRLSLGEQIYVVVPAIEESLTTDMKSVAEVYDQYLHYFPEYKVEVLHGQLTSDEKQTVMNCFEKGEIDILVSTTVIEVGINVLNSTVISIYSPERFGLSTLHQLRGRVGRGEKPGFCFLVLDKKLQDDSMKRLEIIEKTIDGFEISEADLQFRGQGELFGLNQSGHDSGFKLANIFEDRSIFEQVSRDINKLESTQTEVLNNLLMKEVQNLHVSTTI